MPVTLHGKPWIDVADLVQAFAGSLHRSSSVAHLLRNFPAWNSHPTWVRESCFCEVSALATGDWVVQRSS
jgi:hypothetical protein